jgi:hypothetical protein
MVEATIIHNGGTATVEGFTKIEEVEPWKGAETDIKVYYGEPQSDDATYEIYGKGRVVEVST